MELTEYLTEGLVFAKDSKRLLKIADTIEHRSSASSAEVDIVVTKIRGIAAMFQEVEKEFVTDPDAARAKYDILKKKYVDFINLIGKESFTQALKVLGGLGVVAAAVLLSYRNLKFLKEPKNPEVAGPNKFSDVVNGLIYGGTVATAIGLSEAFRRFFGSEKPDDLFEKSKNALGTLEQVERITKIKKVEEPNNV